MPSFTKMREIFLLEIKTHYRDESSLNTHGVPQGSILEQTKCKAGNTAEG